MRRPPVEFLNGYDDQLVGSFLGLAGSDAELRDLIGFLIVHRERLKESAIAELEAETTKFIDQLERLKREELLVELQCFKDTLALQRRLLEHENG